ncbi:MAG: 30S ribosomal protein S4 [Candidatus Uhrbacteria bacterium]
MGRNLGPKHRMCRRAGEKLCDNDCCPSTRRSYPAGVHGPRLRRKLTEYGEQLLEKQKARAVYGILERQLRGYYDKAMKKEGDTGEALSALLECRLDNVVFRLGFTKTRAAARQLVGHGHITVNSKKMNIPSYQVRPGDVIGVRAKSMKAGPFADLQLQAGKPAVPEWLTFEPLESVGRVLRLPKMEEIQQPFQLRGIVEFYSR